MGAIIKELFGGHLRGGVATGHDRVVLLKSLNELCLNLVFGALLGLDIWVLRGIELSLDLFNAERALLTDVKGLENPQYDRLSELVQGSFHNSDELFVGNFTVSILIEGLEQAIDVGRSDLQAQIVDSLSELVLIQSA